MTRSVHGHCLSVHLRLRDDPSDVVAEEPFLFRAKTTITSRVTLPGSPKEKGEDQIGGGDQARLRDAGIFSAVHSRCGATKDKKRLLQKWKSRWGGANNYLETLQIKAYGAVCSFPHPVPFRLQCSSGGLIPRRTPHNRRAMRMAGGKPAAAG
jgi:hypothetical protein